MTVAHDIYAETNPGFCAAVLVRFANAHISTSTRGPDVPVAYLALPLALSGQLDSTFSGTNKATSLVEWLHRSPELQVGLARRVNACIEITTEAVRFGCFTRFLSVGDDARLRPGDQRIKASAIQSMSDESRRVFRRAELLGFWFAAAGSTRAVFDVLGLSL